VRQRLTRVLSVVDEHGTMGSRLIDDAQRLFRRLEVFIGQGLVPDPVDRDGLELACFALQLPMRDSRLLPAGKFGRTNLRERVEQSAEILISTLGKEIDENLLERATRLLLQLPHRNPGSEDAKLLADALNLDDFGITGFVNRTMQLGIQGAGISQVMESADKREEYGYWEARLKDGFHFDAIRKLAQKRLDRARAVHKLLSEELSGDTP
jgi:hypothetical protein